MPTCASLQNHTYSVPIATFYDLISIITIENNLAFREIFIYSLNNCILFGLNSVAQNHTSSSIFINWFMTLFLFFRAFWWLVCLCLLETIYSPILWNCSPLYSSCIHCKNRFHTKHWKDISLNPYLLFYLKNQSYLVFSEIFLICGPWTPPKYLLQFSDFHVLHQFSSTCSAQNMFCD